MTFDFNLHIFHHRDEAIQAIANLKETIMAILDPLAAEVTETKGVMQSAIVLINGLAAQIQEHLNEPEKIQEIINDLKATKAELAEAVAANSPTP